MHVQQASTSAHPPHSQPGRKNKKSNKGGKGGAGEPGKEGAMPVTAEEACDKEEQADKINFLLVPLAAHSKVGPMCRHLCVYVCVCVYIHTCMYTYIFICLQVPDAAHTQVVQALEALVRARYARSAHGRSRFFSRQNVHISRERDRERDLHPSAMHVSCT